MSGPAEARLAERLARIAASNPRLGAFLRVDAAGALEAARAADARRAEGRGLGPLDGMATGIKDNLAMAGAPWTAGIEGRRHLLAERDSGAVARLRAAGAVILGALNMEEGALGAVTDNPGYGRCLNPLGEGLTPGGSSGGSGAALAAGLVDLALGSDTMGSVRIPAAYCGIAALKPTAGLIGRSGLAHLCPSLDAIGPMAREVSLLWPATRALAGLDPDDPDSRPAPPGWAERPGGGDLGGVRLGAPRQIEGIETEPAVRAAFARALAAARDLGAEVVEVDLAGWDAGRARRAGLLLTEAEGAVEMAALMEVPGALSEHFRGLLAYGAAAPSAKLTAAAATLRAAAAACARGLGEADALILPTTAQRAFAHGDPVPANQADLTGLANFAGVPAVALPVPVPGEALPASVQLMGPAWSEGRLTRWAETLDARLRGAD